jgi:hypothetical protein
MHTLLALTLSSLAGAAAAAAAASTPAFKLYADTDDASVAPSGAPPPLVAALGAASGAGACGALCASWRNASDAAQRCESFTFYGGAAQPALRGKCFGLNSVARYSGSGTPSTGNASCSRMLWPCRDALDCSMNGECSASGGCSCSAGWAKLRCGELGLLPVNKSQLGFILGESRAEPRVDRTFTRIQPIAEKTDDARRREIHGETLETNTGVSHINVSMRVRPSERAHAFPAARWWERGGASIRGVWPKCALGEGLGSLGQMRGLPAFMAMLDRLHRGRVSTLQMVVYDSGEGSPGRVCLSLSTHLPERAQRCIRS